jgi:hypothetical protein
MLHYYLPIHFFSQVRTMKLYGNTYNEVVRETHVKWLCILNALNLFRREGYIQRLDILLEMLDLPSTDDGEYIRRFVQDVRNRD